MCKRAARIAWSRSIVFPFHGTLKASLSHDSGVACAVGERVNGRTLEKVRDAGAGVAFILSKQPALLSKQKRCYACGGGLGGGPTLCQQLFLRALVRGGGGSKKLAMHAAELTPLRSQLLRKARKIK